MDGYVTIKTASKLNGDALGTYHSAVSQYLTELGQRQGKERQLALWETLALRTLTELNSAKLNLKEAAQRVVELYPVIRDVAAGRRGNASTDIYIVECWGQVGGRNLRRGFVCEGIDAFMKCMESIATNDWPNARFVNLSALYAETLVGWDIATNGEDYAAARMRSLVEGIPDAAKAGMWARFDEMKNRLDRFGERRQQPPARGHWERGTESSMAVAA